MNYEEFLEYIKEQLPIAMKEWCLDNKEEEITYEAQRNQIVKNNGIVLDGVTLLKTGEHAAPNIYLNSFFEEYQMGKPINYIIREVIQAYLQAKKEMAFDIPDILKYDEVKNLIILRIVNYERNKEQLKDCPYKMFHDLAITFRFLANKDKCGLASSLVSNREFEAWGMDIEDLYSVALFNTMREFPWRMDSLAKVVAECFGDCLPERLKEELLKDIENIKHVENGVNMFVLTNDTGLNGATCILYDNVIRNFAKVQDCNVFILPASIHEVLLVPENVETEPQLLKELVLDANLSAVGLIDLLSDNIYYFDRAKDEVVIYESHSE